MGEGHRSYDVLRRLRDGGHLGPGLGHLQSRLLNVALSEVDAETCNVAMSVKEFAAGVGVANLARVRDGLKSLHDSGILPVIVEHGRHSKAVRRLQCPIAAPARRELPARAWKSKAKPTDAVPSKRSAAVSSVDSSAVLSQSTAVVSSIRTAAVPSLFTPNQTEPLTPDAPAAACVFPAELDTAEFRTAWAEYEQYRREQKLKKLGTTAMKKAMKPLVEVGADEAIRWIEHSMSKGWQGIFPPNNIGQRRTLEQQGRHGGFVPLKHKKIGGAA